MKLTRDFILKNCTTVNETFNVYSLNCFDKELVEVMEEVKQEFEIIDCSEAWDILKDRKYVVVYFRK